MPAIYHPGVVTIAAHYDVGSGRDAVNVFQWQTAASGLTLAQLQAVQTVFDNNWKTLWTTMGASTIKYKGSVVTDNSSNTGAQAPNTAYVPVPGTATGAEVTDSVAFLLSLHTATRYRGGHGRIYIPGLALGTVQNDGRTVSASTISTAASQFSTLQSAMSAISGTDGGPYSLIVWHKKLTSAPNTVELVASVTFQPLLASQRRRLRKPSRHKKKTTP